MSKFDNNVINKNIKKYTNGDKAFRALLGGIGTGNISLDADGRLCDFEIMNRPDKENKIPYTFFSIWSQIGNHAAKSMVIEAKPDSISNRALGHPTGELMGLPRFDACEIETQYPYFRYAFEKEGLPLEVKLEAMTPFIPLDEINSGIPGFKMTYAVTNNAKENANVSVCGTMYNFIGMYYYDGYDRLYQKGTPRNTLYRQDNLTGICFETEGMEENDVTYGSMAMAAVSENATVKPCWQFGGWWDGAEEFWQDFAEDGELCENTFSDAVGSNVVAAAENRYVGSIAVKKIIKPGETKEFTFYITWNYPNRYGWWPDGHQMPDNTEHKKIWKNFYAGVWQNARETVSYFYQYDKKLSKHSLDFANALYATTLNADVIESLVCAITVIRSNTCFRIEDGRFFAWEGCFTHAGSCAGTCTHVWNYAQAMAFLFPKLEQSARYTEFLEETDEEGNMAFRAKRLLDGEKWDMLAAADGQLGSILRVYREWKLSGDSEFLKKVWDKLVLAMDYSCRTWDEDEDNVLEAVQHNTYDIEFYGVNSLCSSIFYAALKACSEMAEFMGEHERAVKWREMLNSGSKKMDEELWNGYYYEQKISDEDLNKYKYQYGKGCLSDQLLGQQFAHIYGLGYILPKEHVKKAVKSVYDYNFKKSLEEHESVQRTYAYQDEAGLVLCSWPLGGRPKQPFVYSDEVWTGIEYQVAVHLIYAGYIDEAMDIVKAIRMRYNGKRRSPYNEIECGNHYARSMAAWGLLIALSGYEYHIPENKQSFAPKINQDNFACFYSNAKEWGIYKQTIENDGTVSKVMIPLYQK